MSSVQKLSAFIGAPQRSLPYLGEKAVKLLSGVSTNNLKALSEDTLNIAKKVKFSIHDHMAPELIEKLEKDFSFYFIIGRSKIYNKVTKSEEDAYILLHKSHKIMDTERPAGIGIVTKEGRLVGKCDVRRFINKEGIYPYPDNENGNGFLFTSALKNLEKPTYGGVGTLIYKAVSHISDIFGYNGAFLARSTDPEAIKFHKRAGFKKFQRFDQNGPYGKFADNHWLYQTPARAEKIRKESPILFDDFDKCPEHSFPYNDVNRFRFSKYIEGDSLKGGAPA